MRGGGGLGRDDAHLDDIIVVKEAPSVVLVVAHGAAHLVGHGDVLRVIYGQVNQDGPLTGCGRKVGGSCKTHSSLTHCPPIALTL